MFPTFQNQFQPFVYLVDSPSHTDLYNGYTIGMALRDALRAIRIPCYYTLATCKETFQLSLSSGLPHAINQMQSQPNTNATPFIHLCMHGSDPGIGLTDGSFLQWTELRALLASHNRVKNFDPYVCMASCNGYMGANMANAFDSAYNILIGHTGAVLQSDVTVAYMSFYNHIFNKSTNFEQAVLAMRQASGDNNFFLAVGAQVKNQRLSELTPNFVNAPFPWPNR